MTEVKPTNFGCFGVADNLAERSSDPGYIGEGLLGENHGAITPGNLPNGRKWWRHIYMVRHHYCRLFW